MLNKVQTTKIFDRNYKKLYKKHLDMQQLDSLIDLIIDEDLATLKRKYRLHQLKNDKAGVYDVHVSDNWLLLYEINADKVLTLLATGDHSILSRSINRASF